jgi:hypothetical protein
MDCIPHAQDEPIALGLRSEQETRQNQVYFSAVEDGLSFLCNSTFMCRPAADGVHD